MNQAVLERFRQAEARTEETKRLVQDIKRITRRKFSTFIEYYNYQRYHEGLGNAHPMTSTQEDVSKQYGEGRR